MMIFLFVCSKYSAPPKFCYNGNYSIHMGMVLDLDFDFGLGAGDVYHVPVRQG